MNTWMDRRKPLTDEEIMDLTLMANLKEGQNLYVCDICGAWAKDLILLNHAADCPEVRHGR